MLIYIIIYCVYFIPDLWVELWGGEFFLELFLLLIFLFTQTRIKYVFVGSQFVADRNSVGFARKTALTISFVERGFERLGLDQLAVGFSWRSYKVQATVTPRVVLLEVGWEALVFGHFSQPPL